jgi:hypothetical protein
MGETIALSCKLHKDKEPQKGETMAKIALTPLQVGRVGAGKAVKITPAQAKYMRGAGFLTDAAKVGSAIVQKIADEFVPNSEAANTVSDILLDVADKVERAFTGKDQFDYEQASENVNTAIARAKAFLAKSNEAKRREWMQRNKTPFLPKVEFQEYVRMQEDLAGRKASSAKTLKSQRFTRMRGDPAAQAAADALIETGKTAIKSKAPELYETASKVKTLAAKAKDGKLSPGKAAEIGKEVLKQVAPKVAAQAQQYYDKYGQPIAAELASQATQLYNEYGQLIPKGQGRRRMKRGGQNLEDINQIIGRYLRQYIGEETGIQGGRQRRRVTK